MAPLSDAELEALLADTGSDRVERQESFRREVCREAVCAFANDLPDRRRPGVVFVGADDAGHPTGLPITDELLRQLADLKTDGNIVPPPTMTVEKRLLAGTPVAVVSVSPSEVPPVRYGAASASASDPGGRTPAVRTNASSPRNGGIAIGISIRFRSKAQDSPTCCS